MPCVCANKVERTQDKVQCDKCNELYHLNCVKLQPADLEYLLKTGKQFVCNMCAAVRRQSLRSPSTPINLDEGIASANNIEHSELIMFVEQHTSKQTLALDAALKEITALKEENIRMVAAVNSLRDDNMSLVKLTESLEAEVRSLHKKFRFDELLSALSSLENLVKVSHGLNTSTNTNAKLQTISAVKVKSKSSSLRSPSSADVVPVVSLCAPVPISMSTSTIANNKTTVNSASVGPAALSLSIPVCETTLTTATTKGLLSYADAASAFVTSANSAAALTSAHVQSQPNADALSIHRSLHPPVEPNLQSPAQWTRMQRRKPKKQNTAEVVIGVNNSTDLDVVTSKKWIHLSSFKSTVSAENIITYVVKNAKIDISQIACFPLIKKDADVNKLRKINFKLGVSTALLDKVLNPMLWPANVKVRPFQFIDNATEKKKSV